MDVGIFLTDRMSQLLRDPSSGGLLQFCNTLVANLLTDKDTEKQQS